MLPLTHRCPPSASRWVFLGAAHRRCPLPLFVPLCPTSGTSTAPCQLCRAVLQVGAYSPLTLDTFQQLVKHSCKLRPTIVEVGEEGRSCSRGSSLRTFVSRNFGGAGGALALRVAMRVPGKRSRRIVGGSSNKREVRGA